MRLFLLAALALSAGCASESEKTDAAYSRMESQISAGVRSAEKSMVAADCRNIEIPSQDFPGMSFKAGSCGLLFDELMANRQLEKEICGPLGLKGEACRAKAKETYFNRAAFRYSRMAGKQFDEVCGAFPLECVDLRKLELKHLAVHNRMLEAELVSSIDQIVANEKSAQKRRQAESSASSANFFQALGGVVSNFGQTPANSRTDPQCLARCQNSGSTYQFCLSKCSY